MTISAAKIREIIASAEAGWTVPEIEANVNGYAEILPNFDGNHDLVIDFDFEPQKPVKLLSGGVVRNFYNRFGEPDLAFEDRAEEKAWYF